MRNKKINPSDYYFAEIEQYPQLPADEQNALIAHVRMCWKVLNRHIFEHPDAPRLFRAQYEKIRKSKATHNCANLKHLEAAENAALLGDRDIAASELALMGFTQVNILVVSKKMKFDPYLREVLDLTFDDAIHARNKVINSNLKLVLKFARKYQNFGLPLDDVIQEGNMGLIRAIETYDASMGVKFSTYAVWWIRKRFMNAIKTSNKLIYIPTHAQETLTRIVQRQDALANERGREPTLEELAATENLTGKQLESLFNVSADPISLDSRVSSSDDNEKQLRALIPDPKADLNLDLDEYKMRYGLARALDMLLTETEREAIILRYGLFGNPTHTLEEIAQVIGKSREYVRQIEKAAFDKIRIKMPYLRDFVEDE